MEGEGQKEKPPHQQGQGFPSRKPKGKEKGPKEQSPPKAPAHPSGKGQLAHASSYSNPIQAAKARRLSSKRSNKARMAPSATPPKAPRHPPTSPPPLRALPRPGVHREGRLQGPGGKARPTSCRPYTLHPPPPSTPEAKSRAQKDPAPHPPGGDSRPEGPGLGPRPVLPRVSLRKGPYTVLKQPRPLTPYENAISFAS